MLVIGHRGAKGKGLGNTLEAMRYALAQGADGLEFDVRLTRDGVPVIIHDDTLLLTRGINRSVHTLTLRELNDLSSDKPVPTLTEVLDEFWGKTYLNIELKARGSGRAVVSLLVSRYITHDHDWRNCLISSFKTAELRAVRALAPHARLALLHGQNPFTFLMYQHRLRLAGLGFHRLHVSLLAVAIAKRLGIFTYAYTVNRPGGAQQLREKQLDAVVTDYPRRIIDALQ